MSILSVKTCSRCKDERDIKFFQYYFIKGEKRWVNNCKDCRKKIIIENTEDCIEIKCNRCKEIQPCTNFDVYTYKGERKRKQCCRGCRLARGAKLPTEVRIDKWLKDSK